MRYWHSRALMAVLGLLLALAPLLIIPGLLETTGHPSRAQLLLYGCEANVGNIRICLLANAEGNHGVLPEALGDLREYYVGGVMTPYQREQEGKRFDQMLVCPVAKDRNLPGWQDGYEYVGMGLRLKEIKNPADTPLVFDRVGNHADHIRSVAFAGASPSYFTRHGTIEQCSLGQGAVERMPEKEFRKVLLEAVRNGAYPPKTVEQLRKDEPWLAKELAPGGAQGEYP